MNDSKLTPYADLKYKVRTYTDKDGKEKGVWQTVGTLFSTPHGSRMSIKLDSVPVGDWNGWLSVYKREEENKPDTLPTDEELEKPVDLSEIPF